MDEYILIGSPMHNCCRHIRSFVRTSAERRACVRALALLALANGPGMFTRFSLEMFTLQICAALSFGANRVASTRNRML